MKRIIRVFVVLGIVLAVLGCGLAGLAYWHFSRDLPDYQQLADYAPPIVTRVHAGDGRLLAEYATERRIFVPISAIPPRVVDAFLAAEDKNFYSHNGIDLASILRAAVTNFEHVGSNRRPVGASTITQQVAKNFLLTSEVSFERKIKEALLALRIERALSKDRILEV
jgi:penicillin-binding protein 1A